MESFVCCEHAILMITIKTADILSSMAVFIVCWIKAGMRNLNSWPPEYILDFRYFSDNTLSYVQLLKTYSNK